MNSEKILVIGAGMVGSAMAIDLAKSHKVTLADKSTDRLASLIMAHKSIQTITLDVKNISELTDAVKPFDLVVCAVPGFLGYNTLKTLIEAGKNIVDISFFPENALNLNDLALKHNVTAIVDCGVAPGLGNIILGNIDNELKITSFRCLVGGLPKFPKWPFNYKAPFSPVDVIEEYTRPARYIENNRIITKEALTDPEKIYFKECGTLEAFNSDGLRSLLFTMPHIPNLIEKTLRYPGHIEYISALKESGFFNTDEIEFNGSKIRPLEFTSKILFKDWMLNPGEDEFTLLQIEIEGIEKTGKKVLLTYTLYDETDKTTKTSSMARTTGYTATGSVEMLLTGLFKRKGVIPPEFIGKEPGCADFILTYLKNRQINLSINRTELE